MGSDQTPYLLLQPPQGAEKTFYLSEKPFYLGRLPENDITIRDQASSRRHCRIEPVGNGFRIVDLASSNGTYINGLRITDHLLRDQDIIQIGKTRLTFRAPQHGAGRSPSSRQEPLPSLLEQSKSPEASRFLEKPPEPEAQGYYLLFQLGRLLVSTSDLKALLAAGLDLLISHFGAQRGCISQIEGVSTDTPPPWPLINLTTKIIDPVVDLASPELPSSSLAQRVLRERKGILTLDALADPRFSGEPSIIKHSVRSALCAPLVIQDRLLGAIYLDHLGQENIFEERDLELLTAAANLLAAALVQSELRGQLEKQSLIRANLERFHSPDVAQSILRKSVHAGQLQREVIRTEATILFSDIKGFTSLSEELEPEEMALLLNNYLAKMTQIIFQHRGTVNKFIGDAVMAIFGAPQLPRHLNPAELAIRAAIDMQKGLGLFLEHIAPHKRFQMRIGINTGTVVAGYIGAENRLEYTVLGDAVNLASRLESLCEPAGILVGPRTYELAQECYTFKSRGTTKIKGKRNTVETFEVVF